MNITKRKKKNNNDQRQMRAKTGVTTCNTTDSKQVTSASADGLYHAVPAPCSDVRYVLPVCLGPTVQWGRRGEGEREEKKQRVKRKRKAGNSPSIPNNLVPILLSLTIISCRNKLVLEFPNYVSGGTVNTKQTNIGRITRG